MNTLLNTPLSRQQGVVLVISLLMLLVLTMIGLAATHGTTIEQRMTANQNDQEVAFEAAEAALRAGESQLSSGAVVDYAGNTAGAYTLSTMGTTNWKHIDWNPSGTAVTGYTAGIQPVPIVNPSYFIVYDPSGGGQTSGTSLQPDQPLSNNSLYYIYARGVGMTGNTAVVLESAYMIANGI
ncbi:MAG TPA: PilX N-terminal domain-containing pilus assembly protein [Gammaproteobacteria bacterium]|jgi:type IV pilus assembly protein PilX|nr:PilX N-terminal domain-containing pilus assembly protein [Gammaproteobacteria bacterium]